jgi:hypothetical protein
LGQNQIVPALFDGTLRNIQESGFLSGATLAEAFGNVGRNGNGCTTQLVYQPKLLPFGTGIAVTINR